MQYPGIRGRRKWRPKAEMGGNGRERGRVLKSVAFVCKMIHPKNHRNARSVYIASKKAWFTAFIAIIKISRT